jgi:hypothetical protein
LEGNEPATEAGARIVFNRSDCPYGCGAELPPKLRWQVTPCARCRRPLHQRSAIVDEEGRVLWPPEGVPRPPDEGQHGVRVQYVVTAEDDRDWRAIWSSTPREVRARERRARSDAWTYLGCLVVAVVILAVVLNLLLWALNLP